MKVGGVVLCGGRSSRMGRSKASLPFGSEKMLQRVVRLLSTVVEPIVVVAAPDQQLPDLPDRVMLAYDKREGRGPLEGLYAGLSRLAPHCDAAYASSCDVPLLEPAFVKEIVQSLSGHDVVVPVEDRFHHPLAAVYRVSVVPHIEKLLAEDKLRPVYLYETVSTLELDVETLRHVDNQLNSLNNVNTPEDYQRALKGRV